MVFRGTLISNIVSTTCQLSDPGKFHIISLDFNFLIWKIVKGNKNTYFTQLIKKISESKYIKLLEQCFVLYIARSIYYSFPGGSDGKESACDVRGQGLIPGSGRSLEKGMAIYSSTLAWRISWTEEPGRLQSMWLQRIRHDVYVSYFHFSILNT